MSTPAAATNTPENTPISSAPHKIASASASATKKSLSGRKTQRSGTAPTSSATQRAFAADIKVIATEHHTGYYLDFQSLLCIASNFSATVRELHRRGGHPQNLIYQGIFFKAMAAKLQAVGIETHQIRSREDLLIGIQGIQLPQVLSHVVAQYGIAYDGTGVKMYPIVTDNLIVYLNHLANLMIQTPTRALFNSANHQNFYEAAYGNVVQGFIGLFKLRNALQVPAVAFDTHDVEGLTALGMSIYVQSVLNGGAVPALNEIVALANAGLGNWFLAGNNVPAAGATPIARQEIVGPAAVVRGSIVNVADPFAAAALPAALTPASAQLVSSGIVRANVRHLGTLYSCSAPVVNSTGSLAPLISIDTLARRVTASSFLFNCPSRDYVTAMTCIGTTSIIVKNMDGCIFNVSTSQGQELDYNTTKMKMSFQEALIAVFDECLK